MGSNYNKAKSNNSISKQGISLKNFIEGGGVDTTIFGLAVFGFFSLNIVHLLTNYPFNPFIYGADFLVVMGAGTLSIIKSSFSQRKHLETEHKIKEIEDKIKNINEVIEKIEVILGSNL